MRLLVTGEAVEGAMTPARGGIITDLHPTARPDRENPTRRAKAEKKALVDGFFQSFAGFEAWLLGSSNFQRLAGLRVTTDAGRTVSYGESTETNQHHGIATFKSARHGFDHCVQRAASYSFRDISRCGDCIDQFRLVHS